MATVNPYGEYTLGGVHEAIWTPITSGDAGGWLDAPHLPDKTITAYGVWNGATLIIQGANAADKSDAFPLTDGQGNQLSKTSDFGETLQENPKYIRPNCTVGGSSTSLTVKCVSKYNL
jgi:hypothetical protein